MESFLNFLGQSWVGTVFGIIGTVVGIIGFVFAVITWRTSRIGPRPAVWMRSLRLIGAVRDAAGEEVEVLYNGEKVPRLTKTYAIFWNGGRQTLYGREIVLSDPIRFELDSGEAFLRARVLKTTRATTEFRASVYADERRVVLCSFDFLDPGDGAIVELLHTSELKYPMVLGTIRGVKDGVRSIGVVSPGLTHRVKLGVKMVSSRTAMWGIFFASTILALGAFRYTAASGMGYVFLFYPMLTGYSLWVTRRQVPKNLEMEDLDNLG